MAEFVRGQLSQGRLVQVLDSKGIDRGAYDLNGANTGDQFVLDHQGRRWSVFQLSGATRRTGVTSTPSTQLASIC